MQKRGANGSAVADGTGRTPQTALRLPAATLAQLDALRGERSRSALVCDLADQAAAAAGLPLSGARPRSVGRPRTSPHYRPRRRR